MPTKNPFNFLDVHTNKGAAHMLAGMAMGQGQPDMAAFVSTGVFVDREFFTIGTAAAGDDDIYAIVDLSTDSLDDILTFWNNTDQEVVQTGITTGLLTVGDYVAVELEIALVTSVVTGATDTVGFYRGVAGTTIVAHATGTDPIEIQEATALVAGHIVVPSVAVTAVAGLAALAAIVGQNTLVGRGPLHLDIPSNAFGNVVVGQPKIKNPSWRFVAVNATTGYLFSTVGGSRAVTLAEAHANHTWSATPTYNGRNANANISLHEGRVPTAEEVTAGLLVVHLNFEPTGASVYVTTTADGLVEAWDGVITLDRVNNLVLLDNAGLVDWAATSTVSIVVHGNVDVADAAVIG